MSKIMRQLVAEGRAARESKLKALGREKKVPEPLPPLVLPVCPRTGVNCIRTPTCGAICMDSWPNVQQQHHSDPSDQNVLWFHPADE